MSEPKQDNARARIDLNSFRALRPGWDSYHGRVIDERAIKRALELLDCLPGRWQAAPRSDGSVQLERHYGGFDIEIGISASGPSTQETGTARLERIEQLMDAKPGTPEGAELDRLADEQVRSEADWLSRPAGGGVAEQLAPVGAASVAPQPTCSKCGAVVRVLEVEPNGWVRLESHSCRATANVEYP